MRSLVAATAAILLLCTACSSGSGTVGPGTSAPTTAPPGPTASAPPSASAPTATAPPASSQPTGQAFSSSQYGYSATIPADTEIAAAMSGWDGGDVDHTAAYADRFYGDGWVIFTLGTPTDLPLAGFVDEHAAWLTANRCPAQPSRAATEIDGAPAVRLAFHCPNGIYGPTLVDKAIAVRDGRGVIFTSMSPDTGEETLAAFDQLLGSVRWTGP